MGEVWRAVDTRLERQVAIKVLTREFADNAQLKVRLEREAKTISQLNHPNICTLHDIGHADGNDFLVMELLEGETLARSLAYSSARELPPNVYVRGLNGVEQAWTKLPVQVYVGGWTADGKSVVASINRLDTSRSDICVISPVEKIREIIRRPANEESQVVSPDGRWVAFESDESGQTEIYVTSLEQPLESWQVSSGGGYLARWSPSGGELLFFAPPAPARRSSAERPDVPLADAASGRERGMTCTRRGT